MTFQQKALETPSKFAMRRQYTPNLEQVLDTPVTRLSSHCWDIRQSSETAANTTNTIVSKYTKSERDVYQMPSSMQLFDDQYLPDKRPKLHEETTVNTALNRSTEVAPSARKAYPFSSLSAT